MTPTEWLEAQPDLIECPIGPCKMTQRACEARQNYFPKLNASMPGSNMEEGLGAVSRHFIHCVQCSRFVKPKSTEEEWEKNVNRTIGTTAKGKKGWANIDGRGKHVVRSAMIIKKLRETGEDDDGPDVADEK